MTGVPGRQAGCSDVSGTLGAEVPQAARGQGYPCGRGWAGRSWPLRPGSASRGVSAWLRGRCPPAGQQRRHSLRGSGTCAAAPPPPHLPGGGASSERRVCSMPRTLRSIVSSASTGRSALLPAAQRQCSRERMAGLQRRFRRRLHSTLASKHATAAATVCKWHARPGLQQPQRPAHAAAQQAQQARTRRVAHAAGGAAQQGHGHVAAALEPCEHKDAQQVAEVQAFCCGVKPAVRQQLLLGAEGPQVGGCEVLQQPPRAQHRHHVLQRRGADARRRSGHARRLRLHVDCCCGGGLGPRAAGGQAAPLLLPAELGCQGPVGGSMEKGSRRGGGRAWAGRLCRQQAAAAAAAPTSQPSAAALPQNSCDRACAAMLTAPGRRAAAGLSSTPPPGGPALLARCKPWR